MWTPIDITDDTSLTMVCTLNQDIDDIDNSSAVSESQSIDINPINLNNNVSLMIVALHQSKYITFRCQTLL